MKLPLITITNNSGSTKTYLDGLISVAASSSVVISDQGQIFRLVYDGQLRSDLLTGLIQLSDGVNNFANLEATSFLSQFIERAVEIADGNQLDGFGRIRVADTDLLEALHFSNTNHPLLMNTAVTGSGTSAFNSSASSIRMTLTTSSSDSVIVQTRRYFRYNPGRSYIFTASGNLGAPKTNVRQRIGYFDVNNGLFFQVTSSGLAVVIRTNLSGSPVDTVISQSSWNLDKLDGTGPSGVTLNTAYHNLYVIDYLWHGAGRVRFGIMYNGSILYCHQYNGANVSASPYMRVPSLPCRVELSNTGTAASGTTLDLVCFGFQKEASDSLVAPYNFSASMAATSKSLMGTTLPLLSIRPTLLFNSLTNRVPIVPQSFQVVANQQITYIGVYLNATLTGASFASVNSSSAVEFDTAATAISGGTLVRELYVPASSSLTSTVSADIVAALELLTLGLDISGSVQDVLTVAGKSTAGGTSTFAQISWQEY